MGILRLVAAGEGMDKEVLSAVLGGLGVAVVFYALLVGWLVEGALSTGLFIGLVGLSVVTALVTYALSVQFWGERQPKWTPVKVVAASVGFGLALMVLRLDLPDYAIAVLLAAGAGYFLGTAAAEVRVSRSISGTDRSSA